MTKQTRRKFSPEFKAKVALEAAKEQLTLAQLSQKFEVNAVTISKWKSEFLANMSAAFSNAKESSTSEQEVPVEQLYAQIGKLKVELDFFKKKCQEIGDTRERMEAIKLKRSPLSLRRQCELLCVPRSSLYYAPIPEKPENLKMMTLMDMHLTNHPTEGVLSMVDLLQEHGYPVGPKRIRRLFKLMGHQTIYRRKNLTKGALKAYIKPYLLRGLKIERANQVWCTDITYIPMAKGIKISMDGKVRATDNIWIERFWKTIKYNHIHLNPYDTGLELFEGVQTYIE